MNTTRLGTDWHVCTTHNFAGPAPCVMCAEHRSDADNLKNLLVTLRENGVTHYKTPELELDLVPLSPSILHRVSDYETSKVAPSDKEIPHVVKELESILKLDDQQMIDRLFPDGAGGEDKASS